MKKYTILFLAALLMPLVNFSQVVDTLTSPLISLDDINGVAQVAYTIGNAANGGNEFINGVPNNLLHAGVLVVIGFIYKLIDKHRLRKKGVLNDGKTFFGRKRK